MPSATPEPTEKIGGEVSVLFGFGGEEVDVLDAALAPFEERTGIAIEKIYGRDPAILRTGVASGNPPDLADLGQIGALHEYAASGDLKKLDDIIDLTTYGAETAPGVVELGTIDEVTYGVNWGGNIKGTIWYNRTVYTQGEPTSWDSLQTKVAAAASAVPGGSTKSWCVALASGPASGWPGTDWIEDLLLRQSGPDVYDRWTAGTLKWTAPEIRRAFEAYGRVVAPEAVFGGADTVLTTDVLDGGNPLFTEPPGCVLHHQASFIPQFFESQGGARPDEYDYFMFPDIDPQFTSSVIGAGNYMVMFNDTPQARALISYMASAEFQAKWVFGPGVLSANRTITKYPNQLLERQAETLASSEIFRYDGSDLMPSSMTEAFHKAMLEYTSDPSSLDRVLANLDLVQEGAY